VFFSAATLSNGSGPRCLKRPASSSSWYVPATAFVFLTVLGFAMWGFYTSLGGRPLWRGDLFD